MADWLLEGRLAIEGGAGRERPAAWAPHTEEVRIQSRLSQGGLSAP
jgi:hypothetical protein